MKLRTEPTGKKYFSSAQERTPTPPHHSLRDSWGEQAGGSSKTANSVCGVHIKDSPRRFPEKLADGTFCRNGGGGGGGKVKAAEIHTVILQCLHG